MVIGLQFFLCLGISLFFQYFFPFIAIYIDFWIGFEGAAMMCSHDYNIIEM